VREGGTSPNYWRRSLLRSLLPGFLGLKIPAAPRHHADVLCLSAEAGEDKPTESEVRVKTERNKIEGALIDTPG